MEHKEENDGLQGKELQAKAKLERLLEQLRKRTDRLLNIAHKAHHNIRDIRVDRPTPKRSRIGIFTQGWSWPTSSISKGIGIASILASGDDKKLLEDFLQEATEHVDQANNIISEMVDILNEAGETGLSFEELSLTFPTDRRGWDDGTALGLDIDRIVEKLKRQERHIENLYDKLE
ncbi:hypothetical protein Pmani_025062 [Petrolisthes manimaculis]|uniref:Uncharacterized protein n=1 Tax=Petrolisthes manimaculis TaxID=1843537 RepID=A0AAE1TYQ1_9EUCA|nr:hypothetical protein Pmani_025062 [Petrolisthes manimaculis]